MSEVYGEGTGFKKPIKKVQEKVQEETVSKPARNTRAILFQAYVIAAISGFAILALLAHTIAYFSIDVTITRAVQALNFLGFGYLMRAVSWPGFSPQAAAIPTFLIAFLLASGLRWEGTMAAATAVGVEAINYGVKTLIARPRPSANIVHVFQMLNSYSFPSGHVMFYTGFFGFMWFLAFTLLKPSWKRTTLLILFGGLVVLVGISRIYLGEHWASDVLGGYLLGSLCLAAAILAYRWGKTRYFTDQPVAR